MDFIIIVTIGVLLNTGQFSTVQFRSPDTFTTFALCDDYMRGPEFLDALGYTQNWVTNQEKVDVLKNTTTKCMETPDVK